MDDVMDDADWNRWRGRTDQRLDGHDVTLANLTELVGGVDTKLDKVILGVARIETRTTTLDTRREFTHRWKLALAGIAGSGVFGICAGLLGWLHR